MTGRLFFVLSTFVNVRQFDVFDRCGSTSRKLRLEWSLLHLHCVVIQSESNWLCHATFRVYVKFGSLPSSRVTWGETANCSSICEGSFNFCLKFILPPFILLTIVHMPESLRTLQQIQPQFMQRCRAEGNQKPSETQPKFLENSQNIWKRMNKWGEELWDL